MNAPRLTQNFLDPSRQRHGTDHTGTRALCCFHNRWRLVQYAMVISLESDPDLLLRHSLPFSISFDAGDLAVQELFDDLGEHACAHGQAPRGSAKVRPCSNPTGTISFTVIVTLSPASPSPSPPVTGSPRHVHRPDVETAADTQERMACAAPFLAVTRTRSPETSCARDARRLRQHIPSLHYPPAIPRSRHPTLSPACPWSSILWTSPLRHHRSACVSFKPRSRSLHHPHRPRSIRPSPPSLAP